MSMALANVVSDIHRAKRTGLLSIVIRNSGIHYKVFFKDGEIYHLVFGASKDGECLSNFDGLEPTECFFVSGVKLDIEGKDLPATTEIIRRFESAARTVEIKWLEGETEKSYVSLRIDDYTRIAEGIKTALVSQIGPAGIKVFSRVVDEKWRAAHPPTKKDFLDLVGFLSEEIDDSDNRNEFIKEANAVIQAGKG